MGRFLSPKDISAARFEEEVFNSRLKRGDIKAPETIVSTRHVVCGCGAVGCIFLSHEFQEPADKQLFVQLKREANLKTEQQ